MSNKKKVVVVVSLVAFIFIIIVAIGYLIINEATQEDILRKEVSNLALLDITRDRYNTKIKTHGSYAIVEEEIKSYLDNYAINMQKVLEIVSDDKLITLLSASNYSDDEDFSESILYVQETKKKFNNLVDELILFSDDNSIMDNINDSSLDSYYISLYKELIYSDDISNKFMKNNELLKDYKVSINNLLDISLEVFNFLNANRGNWEIQDGEIVFQNNTFLEQYNNLISKIKNP